MDSDDSGYISTGNIRKLLGHHIPSNHIEDIILEAESELNYTTSMKNTIDSKPAKDHFISYEEFLALWDDQHDQEHRQGVLKKITEMRRKQTLQTSTNDHSERLPRPFGAAVMRNWLDRLLITTCCSVEISRQLKVAVIAKSGDGHCPELVFAILQSRSTCLSNHSSFSAS